ncbi:MAG TPA: 16S rRNA (cytosine(967)-C(5))-methyltransferase RsmB [Myxococcota bacterium]|nr:16S rRNA (cytosine(967)-C(5))-methyltransferase RsmB [Myxococcota bacterium]
MRPRRARRGRPAGRAGMAAGGPERGGPSRARLLALRVLERVERGAAFADLALHAGLRNGGLGVRDRALATELVYGTLRWRGRLDWLLAQVIPRPIESLEPPVRSLLRLGAYQIVFLAGIPEAAAVDQSVRAARAIGVERAAGLVNAALRRLAREHAQLVPPTLEADPLAHLVHGLSLPEWIARRWLDRFGPAEAAALAAASNAVPPLTVRAAGVGAHDRDALLEELSARWPDARPTRYAPRGIVLGRGGNPAADPAFAAGRFAVQDEGSQLVVALLGAKPGESALDTCAAPGGKAAALAEDVGALGRVVAVDVHARRLALLGREARRLGLGNLGIHAADARGDLSPIAPPASFDRVLVDAPCSGLGTLRRNPDLRWRARPDDAEALGALQLALLRRAALALRRGGALVYSTCTLTFEENEAVVNAFLAEAPGFAVAPRDALPAPLRELAGDDGFLRTFPHRHDADGFFAARLERVR